MIKFVSGVVKSFQVIQVHSRMADRQRRSSIKKQEIGPTPKKVSKQLHWNPPLSQHQHMASCTLYFFLLTNKTSDGGRGVLDSFQVDQQEELRNPASIGGVVLHCVVVSVYIICMF
jgi:hypothetical protein